MQSTYDLTVQIADMVYVGRYQHASEYLPSNWVAGQSVDARVGKHKHRIYLKDVQGKEVALVIVIGTQPPQSNRVARHELGPFASFAAFLCDLCG
jgi:hypothetical protein